MYLVYLLFIMRKTNVGRAWRYQRGNQDSYIVEEQTTQWPKEKVQKDKQRSIKHTHKTTDRVTRTPLKTGNLHTGRSLFFLIKKRCAFTNGLYNLGLLLLSLFLFKSDFTNMILHYHSYHTDQLFITFSLVMC